MTETAVMVVWQIFAFAIGLTLGSFANVAIDRLPYRRSLLPRSRCDRCDVAIRPKDLIPVVSWVVLRGRCRDCSASIPAHVPLVELLVGLLALLLFRRLVPDPNALDAAHLSAWVVYLLFLLCLTIGSYADIRYRIIPDETSFLAIPVAIAGAFAMNYLGYQGWLAIEPRTSVVGALAGMSLFAMFRLLAGIMRGPDALGWGDIKVAAMLGAFLGPMPGLMVSLIVGSVIGAAAGIVGIVVLGRRSFIPYGPPLAIGATIYVFFGYELVETLFPGMAQFFLNGSGWAT